MKLKLTELIQLNYELNGLTIPTSNGDKVILSGLFKQKTSLKVKFYLQRLNNLVTDELKTYENLRMELFKKYGKENDDKTMSILDEHIEQYNNDHNDLLSAEKEIDVQSLWANDLNIDNIQGIETDEIYPIFLKLIDK